MPQLWCPFAVKRPGPSNKHGYDFAPSPSPKRGWVPHSMEGSLSTALNILDSQVRPRKSWTFSIAKDGTIYQHYEVTANCWHAGDTDDDGGVRANIDLVGVEHEGVRGDPLTEAQISSSANLYLWHEQEHGWLPYKIHSTVFEHNWVSDTPTSCPSGRIPHDAISANIIELKRQEATMILDSLRTIEVLVTRNEPVLIKTAHEPAMFVTDGISTRYIPTMQEVYVYRLARNLQTVTVPDDYMLADRKQALAEYMRWK